MIVLVISVLGLICCAMMIVLIFIFRYFKPIIVSSPIFCYLQLVGISMAYISVLLKLGKPNAAKCISLQLLLTVGFVLVIGSIIAKNYRYMNL